MDAYLLGKLSHAPSNCLEVAGRGHLGLDHGVPGQLQMGGEMEVVLDELAVGPVKNILHRGKLSLVLPFYAKVCRLAG